MLACKLLLALVMGMHCIQLLMAACVCSEKGTDYCQSCQGSTVIRPKPRYYEPSDVNLPPIGDNCWCSKQLIEPAQLPKTCGKTTPCKPTCSCQQISSDSSYASSSSSGSVYGKIDYAAEKIVDNSPAADPISVSLAAQAGKAINVPEAKLAYGFAQKPVDGEKKVVFSNVPEENLFKLKSDVITLKKRTYATKQEDEEEYAEEEQEQEQSSDDEEAPQLTYKQLGYITEQYKNPKFRKISSSSSSYAYKDYKDSSESGYGKVAGKVSVDCGFKPGRITSYRKSKREESDDGYY
uniref:Chorion protein a at 7F, isoform A n=1 Tax=Drosophila melanogaster TaxID=7227 RepID=Q5BI73_DROME|eukprot:NP_001033837.1 chorion protein a at 7F [Drosophila melanogaster]